MPHPATAKVMEKVADVGVQLFNTDRTIREGLPNDNPVQRLAAHKLQMPVREDTPETTMTLAARGLYQQALAQWSTLRTEVTNIGRPSVRP